MTAEIQGSISRVEVVGERWVLRIVFLSAAEHVLPWVRSIIHHSHLLKLVVLFAQKS